MRWLSPARHVLLTGAGFTRNFGGYLANQMWAAIFKQPEIRAEDALRRGMLNILNYEIFYDLVLNSPDYSEHQRRALMVAIRRAYEEMHSHICHDRDPQHTASAVAVCRTFMPCFAGTGRQRGFFFTLNQDLFIEHFFGTGDHTLSVPGLHSPRWFNRRLGPTLDAETRVALPKDSDIATLEERFWDKGSSPFVYVKLHGSLNWVGHRGGDVMVIGQTKSALIQEEPLLRWYLTLFKDILSRPETYLITIGYGFRDQHINDIIANAIRDHNLRLCVVAPLEAEEFHRRLMSVVGDYGEWAHRGGEIWQGLYYYYQGPVTDLYDPTSVRLPPRGQEFFKDIDLPC